MDMNDVVVAMIEEHEGGEKFFDNLDERVQNNSIIQELFYLKNEVTGWYAPTSIIASGKFGLYLNSAYPDLEMILVNGGLRKKPIISLEFSKQEIFGRPFVFLDDSFYLGRTRDAIAAELQKWGGYIAQTVVCYDGSKIKRSNVHSLYRYYDHFTSE